MSDYYNADDMAFTPEIRQRILAECAAKRAVIAACERLDDQRNESEAWSLDRTEDVILAPIAAVYADHPDYRQDWDA